MSEDNDEGPSSEADFEELMEAIQEEREERQEQVSFECCLELDGIVTLCRGKSADQLKP